ncbi:MAG: CoA transferase, partial [Acidimicrobiia bacterium]|nr:CoA transferase [Acidimicrobiia bacterium]
EWIVDERFVDRRARYENAKQLIAELDAIFATRPLAEWAEVFDSEPEFFWAPVNSPDDILADPQLEPSGALIDVPDWGTALATPVDFHGTPWQPTGPAPGLGEHADEILLALGRDDQAIAELVAGGAVIKPT